MHAEHLDVVADVADDGHVGGNERGGQPADEAGTADAAREDADLHVVARHARVRGPQRAKRRSRSASVSTSSTRFGTATVTLPAVSPRKRSALPGPYTGANTDGEERPSAFVVPSAASTSASPCAGIASVSASRSSAVTQGRSALTTSAAPAPTRASAAAT